MIFNCLTLYWDHGKGYSEYLHANPLLYLFSAASSHLEYTKSCQYSERHNRDNPIVSPLKIWDIEHMV